MANEHVPVVVMTLEREMFPDDETYRRAKESSERVTLMAEMRAGEPGEKLDISGIPISAVLAALYNAAQPVGMGFLQAQEGDMSLVVAEELCNTNLQLYFDYVYGRPLKVDLSENPLDTRLYDQNWGEGAAARAIASAVKVR